MPFGAAVDGWSAGFSAWAGGLLLTAAGVLVVLRRSGTELSGGRIRPSLLVACAAAVGVLPVVIRWASFRRYHGAIGLSYEVGASYGIYLALIAAVAAAVLDWRRGRAGAVGCGGSGSAGGLAPQRSSGSSSWRLHSCQEPA